MPADTAAAEEASIAPHTQLLLIHSGGPDGAMVQAWMQSMLMGAKLHLAHFDDLAIRHQLQHQPQLVFIHFTPATMEAATALAGELQALHPRMPRVAVGHTKTPDCMLAALRAGVQDFLDVDAPTHAVLQTVQALLSRSPVHAAPRPGCALTALVSARAGMGTSLLASHLALHVQHMLQQSATGNEPAADALQSLLIDLGSPSSDCGLYLNTAGEFDFVEAVSHLRRFDRRLAHSALARHASGLHLLGLPRQPEACEHLASSDVDGLLLNLRQYFQHVFADLGAVAVPRLASRLALKASEIWVVCDQSVASVVSTTELLLRLDAQQVDRKRMGLIVNRHDRQLELDAQQIAQQLQLPLLGVIPERRRELVQAVNQGRLLTEQPQVDPYMQAVQRLAAPLLSRHHPRTAAAPATGVLSRFLQHIRRS